MMQNSSENDQDNENEYTHEAYQNSNLNDNPDNHDITNPNDTSGINPKRYDSFDAGEDVTDSGNLASNKANKAIQNTYSNEDDIQLNIKELLDDENDDSEDEINKSKNDNEKFFGGGL